MLLELFFENHKKLTVKAKVEKCHSVESSSTLFHIARKFQIKIIYYTLLV